MITARRSATLSILLAFGLGLGGCATSGTRAAEAKQQARRAISHMNIGADHLHWGRAALALREMMTAESLNPKNPRIQYALAEVYLIRDRPAEAEQHFLQALVLQEGLHDARLSLSALYIVQARYEEAIAACQLLLDDPTFPAPWRALANRGWSEYRLGRSAEARGSLGLAREYREGYWPAMLSMAVLEAAEGNRLEAIGLLQELIELGPGPGVESEANYRLARNYVALGKRTRAMRYLTAAVDRAPDGEWARRSQDYLKLLH
jgi:Tfp pilus assembly protein PilF